MATTRRSGSRQPWIATLTYQRQEKTSTEEEKLVNRGGEMVAMFLPENRAALLDRHTVGSWTFHCNHNPENLSPAGP